MFRHLAFNFARTFKKQNIVYKAVRFKSSLQPRYLYRLENELFKCAKCLNVTQVFFIRQFWPLKAFALRHNQPCNLPLQIGSEVKLPITNEEIIFAVYLFRLLLKFLWIIWDVTVTIYRLLRLCCTFFPIALLYPVSLIHPALNRIWQNGFLYGLELSGPIFVKLGQWASTRKDLFNEDFCLCLSKLQRRTSPHSWYFTNKTLEKAYGENWRDLFVEFDSKPIGSGCCAQVYRACIKEDILRNLNPKQNQESANMFFAELFEMIGINFLRRIPEIKQSAVSENNIPEKEAGENNAVLPVAVKVLHPGMMQSFRRDLNIMKALANFITWIFPNLKWLSLSECVNEFSRVMQAQVDFRVEANNLERFASNFHDIHWVKFPQPLTCLTKSYLLVETYEEGISVQNYVNSQNCKQDVRRQLADIGIKTLLKMVFEDNFAHGDLHPGNMLVQEFQNSKKKWLRVFKRNSCSLRLIILDCGIVASLDEYGTLCLKGVFAAVADGNGRKVAELFLENSNHECTDAERFKRKMTEIVSSALHNSLTLEKISVSSLMSSLFSTMIEHKVKIEGSFSSVVLAMLVVEGIGRSLDPSLDIISKARPYLLNVF